MSEQSQGPGWWQASDGRWYPPQSAPSAPQYAHPQTQAGYGPPPASSGGSGCLKAFLIVGGIFALLGVIGVIALIAIGSRSGDDQDEEAFCDRFADIRDVMGQGGLLTAEEEQERFEGFAELIDEFEAAAPSEMESEAEAAANGFRSFHQLVIDVDFDSSGVTDEDLSDAIGLRERQAVTAVGAHCGSS